MGVIKGLKAIEKISSGAPSVSEGQRVVWLKLEDGQSAKIRFLNELDADSPHYNPKFDVAVVVQEHSNPKDYKRKAVCTADTEGRCFGCEMARKEPKSTWRAKNRYYTNVLVDDGVESPYVAVWSQGIFKQSAFNTIKEYFLDTGSVSNLTWKIRRQGTGTNTNYVLLPTTPDTKPFDSNNLTPFNLEKVVREVPYSEQEAFYLGFDGAVGNDDSTSGNINW